jgi:hypothetical protein
MVVAGCSSGGSDDENASLVNGLEQHVSISPASPSVGDALTVRSVLVNRSASSIVVDHYSGESLQLSGVGFVNNNNDTLPGFGWPFASHSTLAPGDSLVAQRRTAAISSKAGDYLFFVQQLSSPSVGVTIHLRVKAARTPR